MNLAGDTPKFFNNGRGVKYRGFTYRVNKHKNDITYWQCTVSNCYGRLKTSNDKPTIESGTHSHETPLNQVTQSFNFQKNSNHHDKHINHSDSSSGIFKIMIESMKYEFSQVELLH